LRTGLTPSRDSVAIPATVAVTRIHRGKQPRRPHFIPEWAATRKLKAADLARELGADKSVVSRWYGGASPGAEWQEKLAALFQCDPEALFRHPDDDWLSRFFRGRQRDEIERIKATLEAAFPQQRAG
jgi:transcriptional regulator with XRE-family HTH domain